MSKVKKKNLPLRLSEILIYLIAILSVVNIIMIYKNSGNYVKMPTGLAISDLASVIGWDLWQDGMLPGVGWYWATVIFIGIVPPLIIALLGFLAGRGRKQPLIIDAVLLVIDALVLLCFIEDIVFFLLNLLLRILILAVIIAAIKKMK